MYSNNSYNPDKVFHPGVTLQETLVAISMSQVDLAVRTGLTPKTINEIIQGKNPISPETAIKLANVFGTSVNFWNDLQRNYEADLVRIESQKKLAEEAQQLSRFSICYSELVKYKYIEKTSNKLEKVKNLFNFFGVSSLGLIPNVHSAVFRQSKHKNVNKESLAGWLRCGEINAQKIKTNSFDKEKLQKSLLALRSLTQETDPNKLQKTLEEICESVGVALVLVPYFRNTHVNGAAWWLNQEKAIIQLSLKGNHIDSFWFTFFHEVGHLLKHGKKEQYIDYKKGVDGMTDQKIEEDADRFANDLLISKEAYETFIQKADFSPQAIKIFADQVGVSQSIVAGRICHTFKDNKRVWRRFSSLRTRYIIANNAV